MVQVQTAEVVLNGRWGCHFEHVSTYAIISGFSTDNSIPVAALISGMIAGAGEGALSAGMRLGRCPRRNPSTHELIPE